jgi:hypothetical protein
MNFETPHIWSRNSNRVPLWCTLRVNQSFVTSAGKEITPLKFYIIFFLSISIQQIICLINFCSSFLHNQTNKIVQNCWVYGLCPSSGILNTGKHLFENWICFRPPVSGGRKLHTGVQRLRLDLSEGLNRVGASLSSPEDGNGYSSRNAVFFRYLEFWTMDKVEKPSNFECFTPSSEFFRF